MSEQRGVVVRTTVYDCIGHYTRIEDKKNTAKKAVQIKIIWRKIK